MKTFTLSIEAEGLEVQEFGIPAGNSSLLLSFSYPRFSFGRFHGGSKLGQLIHVGRAGGRRSFGWSSAFKFGDVAVRKARPKKAGAGKGLCS